MHKEFKKYPEIGKEYQHYKGGKYIVISMAKHSETGDDLVIYKSVHFGSVYARPLSMWFEEIEAPKSPKANSSLGEIDIHKEKIFRFRLIE